MMRECWLKPNRRALLMGCSIPSVGVAVGIGMMLISTSTTAWGIAGLAAGGLMVTAAGTIALGLLAHAMIPRVAFDHDQVLVYLRGHRPYRLPLDVVECFFQGQGPSGMMSRSGRCSKTTNVVVRIAERATQWHECPVKQSLGEWQNGYIVIRGTWSEPITEEKLRELNSKLAKAKRRLRAATEDEA
jgi:hypothetical protein